jgi:thiol-disulfide isomerase/thioredoxin
MLKNLTTHPWLNKPWVKKLTPSPFTLILLALIAYFWFRPPAWVSDEHQAVSNISITTTDNRVISMADLRGKVVIVSFWATWCPYCRHEMPAIQAFYRDWQGKGVEVLALSIEDDSALVAQFMRQENYSFPAAIADATTQQAFGKIDKVPMSFIVDKKGIIRHKVDGQVYYGRLQDLVTPLLQE